MRIPALSAVFLILVACAGEKSVNQKITTELDNYLSQQFSPDEPGGAILLMKGDHILFSKGFGLSDLKTREPVTPNTLFNLGSISKTFVANGILVLQQQGKLSLEDSLYKFFPEFKNKTIAQTIKVKHLLTHTSGLPDIRDVQKDTAFFLTAKDGENWHPVTQTDSLLFEPGSQFEYSNPAFNGLALIIEKVSGMKWQQFVSENIFKPSEMNSSTITDGPHPNSGVSHAYVMNSGAWTEDDYGEEPTFAAAGNGGVWSSVEELAKYEKAHWQSTFLTKGNIDDSRSVKRFPNWKGTIPFAAGWSWFTPQRDGNAYLPIIGWSWFITTTPSGARMIGHTGSQGGFLCNYASIPEKRLFFVILCNSPRDIIGMSNKLMEVVESYGL